MLAQQSPTAVAHILDGMARRLAAAAASRSTQQCVLLLPARLPLLHGTSYAWGLFDERPLRQCRNGQPFRPDRQEHKRHGAIFIVYLLEDLGCVENLENVIMCRCDQAPSW